ncbi:unnamed protein product, partial [Oppiella nova]
MCRKTGEDMFNHLMDLAKESHLKRSEKLKPFWLSLYTPAKCQPTHHLQQWRTGGGRSHDRLVLEFRGTKWSFITPSHGSLRAIGTVLWEIMQDLDARFLDEHIITKREELDDDLFKYQISYNTDDPKNIRLVSGALAITAIHERHQNRNFTSATIVSNKFFSYGKIDTRIAIPGGQALKSAIFLLPYDDILLDTPNIECISTVNFENLIYSRVFDHGNYSTMEYLPRAKLDKFNTFTIDYQRIGLIVDETLSGGHRETIDMKARQW